MIYASVTDFASAIPERTLITLTNPGNPGATMVDVERLEAEAARQSAVMAGYLRRWYALPLAPPYPLELVACCVDMAVCGLEHQRPREDSLRRRESWIRWLERVAKGEITLDLPPAVARAVAGAPVVIAPPESFGSLPLEVW